MNFMKKYLFIMSLAFCSFFQIIPMEPLNPEKVSVNVYDMDARRPILYILAPDENYTPTAGDPLLANLTERSVFPGDKSTVKMSKTSAFEIITPEGVFVVRRSNPKISISKKMVFEVDQFKDNEIDSQYIINDPMDIFYRTNGQITISNIYIKP